METLHEHLDMFLRVEVMKGNPQPDTPAHAKVIDSRHF